MDILYSAELAIPIYQVGLLMIVSTLCLLFGKIKFALLVNYVFTLYWGYWLNRDNVIGAGIAEIDSFTIGYFGFGFLIGILALVGFLLESNR